jgi:hypothetical protein
MTPDIETAYRNILDLFTGADGGVRFVKWKSLIESLDKQAEIGDKSAKEVLKTVILFSRLINIANK